MLTQEDYKKIHRDFFSKGHVLFENSQFDRLIAFEMIEWIEGKGHLVPKELDMSIQSQLITTHWELARQFVAPIFKDFLPLKSEIWSGINKSAHQWHCDYEEGHNLVFLLYFNDMSDDGHLWTKTPEGLISRIIPNKGTLVMLNTWPNYMHKADPTTQTRIVADFRFKITED